MEKSNKVMPKRLALPIAAFALGVLLGVSIMFLVEVIPLQGEYADLSNRYASLQANISKVKGEYVSLQANVSKLKGEYNALASKYDALIAPQPKISIVDVTKYNARAGGFCIISQDVGADFALVNTGKANGIAKVTLLTSGGSKLAENTYLVSAGTRIERSLTVRVDCTQTFNVALSLEVLAG